MQDTLIVIPARMESKRLPGKPLLDVCGEPLVVRTWRAARVALGGQQNSTACIATDSPDIHSAVQFYLACFLTKKYRNGTQRVAAVARDAQFHYSVILNHQCDEPEVPPTVVRRLIGSLPDAPDRSGIQNAYAYFEPAIATLAAPLDPADRDNPNVVKVVVDDRGRAMHFTRSPIPGALRHIGVYAFTPTALTEAASLPQSELGRLESLEQLDWLCAGMPIKVVECEHPYRGIDTEDDYREFVARFQRRRDRELAERQAATGKAHIGERRVATDTEGGPGQVAGTQAGLASAGDIVSGLYCNYD